MTLKVYTKPVMVIYVQSNREGHIWAPLDQAQSWQPMEILYKWLSPFRDGGATWQRFPSVYAALAVGIGKAAPEASYETIFIWGVADLRESLGYIVHR
jgi:hypothetical protein